MGQFRPLSLLRPWLAMLACAWSVVVSADTSLDVQAGWGGRVRDGRWAPLIVTAADSKPRNAVIEVYAASDGANAMRVRQFMALNPQPTTVELYAPLTAAAMDSVTISLKDPNQFRALADFPDSNADPSTGRTSLTAQFIGGDTALIGVSGREPTLRLLENPVADHLRLSVGFLEQRFLPAAPIGYDSLDALVLNAPDLSRMEVEQQQAIADWVRAGGSLIFWPSDAPWPSAGPLLDILPGPFGEIAPVQLSDAQLASAGLPARFKSIKARTVEPSAGWERVPLFGEGGPTALRRRVGFGQVLASPIDLGLLQFPEADPARAFWEPLLKRALIEAPVSDKDGNAIWQSRDTRDSRGMTAVASLANRLGDVPGAGSFDFTYVVVVLVAMMLLVGPIDYFVLRKYNLQPWTWVTTTAWIVLITAAALGLGHFLKSGDLYYRTLRLVDQADDAVVSSTDLVGVYSPRTSSYELSMRPETWWRPASPSNEGFRRQLLTDWDAGQTYRGNSLAPMYINVWNLRFAAGRTFGQSQPLLSAKLSVHQAKDGSSAQLVGTITNLGSSPMGDLRIQTKAGRLELEGENRIAPGQTINIDGPLIKIPEAPVKQEDALDSWRHSHFGDIRTLSGSELAPGAADLAPGASMQVERLLKDRDDVACIYAMTKLTDPAVKLVDREPNQEHWLAVRALVDLKPSLDGDSNR